MTSRVELAAGGCEKGARIPKIVHLLSGAARMLHRLMRAAARRLRERSDTVNGLQGRLRMRPQGKADFTE